MPASITSLPRPLVFGAYGSLAGLLVALALGEVVWYLLAPAAPAMPEPTPDVAPHTVPPKVLPPKAQLAITVSPKVQVYVGEKNTVAVRVARDRYKGPVAVQFDSVPGLSAAELTIDAAEASGTSELTSAVGTKPGTYKLTATAVANADGRPIMARATVEVTVMPLLPPAPRLSLRVSPRLQAYQRGANTFSVRIARDFDDEVTVSFDDLPDGVKIAPITIPAGATEATGQLTVQAAPVGSKKIIASAGAKPKGKEIYALTNTTVLEVLASPKVPVDIVFALDCTGSMKKAVNGIADDAPTFAAELAKANLDPQFGLVGFQDTTLGQPLQFPLLDGERMSARAPALRLAMRGVKLGGGGGEGESSMDGIEAAANRPMRDGAVRVIVLVTDGGPKKVDGFVKSADALVKHLKAKKIDQLHFVALPEHRKQFEPLWEGAKGLHFDLKAASEANAFDKLLVELAKEISNAIPVRPVGKVNPGQLAAEPVLPPPGSVKPPALPPGADPVEPTIEKPAEVPPPEVELIKEKPEPEGPRGKALALVAWALVIVFGTSGAVAVGQFTFLPGARPAALAAAVGYSGGNFAGLFTGAVSYVAFDFVGVPFLGRVSGAVAFGACVGALVPLAELLFREKEDSREEPEELEEPKEPKREPEEKPMELPSATEKEEEVLELGEVVPAHKPTIAPPKPRDGCPGCGRVIPGPAGERYCMLCDKMF